MSRYTYKLHHQPESRAVQSNTYQESQLKGMTTYQLREICRQEKLVKNILNPLDKEELVRLIMRYRGSIGSRCIKSFCEGGIERVESFLKKTVKRSLEAQDISIPAKIVLYEKLGIDVSDNYNVMSSDLLTEGNVLLVDDENEVCTVFYLKENKGGGYRLLKNQEVPIVAFSKKQYYLLFLNSEASESIYDIYMGKAGSVPHSIKVQKVPLLDIQIKAEQASNSPLIIDFGTSNTTAGTYNQDGSFRMIEWEGSQIIPSIIGVTGIKDEQPEFLFGYDALAYQKSLHFDQDLPIFYDIKRFMSGIERKEHIITDTGIRLKVPRQTLIREFLLYMIQLAKQQFKCSFSEIQFLAPVRQKKKFNKIFQELLPEYTVGCSLDEGMAVLFHSIKSLIDQNSYEKRQTYRALIMDCGGGTTDLTSCEFSIDNNRVAYAIDMRVSYENGDTNFGGNNITYRIMQVLKIRLAGMHAPLKRNSFRNIDRNGKQKLYQELDDVYNQAEAILPTKYKDYEDNSIAHYFRVKHNYYYLFEIAEQIKREFFYNDLLYELIIGTVPENDAKKQIVMDKWKLSVARDGSFTHLDECKITFYLYEVEALLKVEIYSLMKKFLERPFLNGELMDYEIIKITGQSCKSPLFMEALREFVPGRIIQDVREEDQNGLKLCCLQGALSYFQSKTLGYVEAHPVYTVGALPYEVCGVTHENEDKILIHSLQKRETTSWISRFKEGNQIHFYLKDIEGNLLKGFHYDYRISEFKQATHEEIVEQVPNKIIQEETDHIINGETRFFVWDSREDWGFYILPVLRDQDQLHIGETSFFDFEDDTWEMNFFDGRK